jgi:hypothetical protein
MKNMTNAKARSLGKRELRKIFTACKFRDALTLDEGDKSSADDFIFYYNKARDLSADRQAGQVGNYLVYEVISTDAVKRADDAVIGREFFAGLDVFSVKSFESKLMQDTLAKLEDKLVAAGFEVEAGGEDYESDTRFYHQILYASKLYI